MTPREQLHAILADALGGHTAAADVALDVLAEHRALTAEWLLSEPIPGIG